MAVLPGSPVDRAAEIITRYNMARELAEGDATKAGVAVSGGCDSVSLLHILHKLKERFGFQLTVLHVNHHLRGSESDGDQEFVEASARNLGCQCVLEHAPVGGGNLEQEARDARRAFFQRVRAEMGLKFVALGHTRSDQAETVLFRLLRGAGTLGLAGMKAISGEDFVRPLLEVSRAELREWAQLEGIAWREDRTNADEGFARNRLRLRVMPELASSFNSNLEAVLAGMASVAQAENDYWDGFVASVYATIVKRSRFGLQVDVAEMGKLHLAVQRRLMRRAVSEIRGNLRSIDLSHVEGLLRLCRSPHGHDRLMAPGVDAVRSFETLLLAEPGAIQSQRFYSLQVALDTPVKLPFGAGQVCVKAVTTRLAICGKFEEETCCRTEVAYLDGDALAASEVWTLTVRNWQPGDAMRRPGRENSEKLKTLFQEFRIPLWERRHWPVVTVGNEIIWARRFGSAAAYAAIENSRLFQLTYKEDR